MRALMASSSGADAIVKDQARELAGILFCTAVKRILPCRVSPGTLVKSVVNTARADYGRNYIKHVTLIRRGRVCDLPVFASYASLA